jgi:cellulose synthase/poly-beta-1,6-N-acetylglucosamine synthase-like glycosyltransferase
MDPKFVILMGLYYFMIFSSVFWLLVYFRNRKHMKKDPFPETFPKVSIIIPVWNGEKVIERAIDSCLNLNYPDREIIVVNDGSTDGTRKICEAYAKKRQIILLNKENGGKATALNYGIKQSSGELVSCLDADSYFSKNALLNMVGYFKNKNVAAVTPAMKLTEDRTIWQKIQVIEYYFSIYLRKLFSVVGCQYVTPGPGSVYRKDVLLKIGGFDEGNITEDMEIAFRMVDFGYDIENSSSAFTYTDAPEKLGELVKQRTRWYAGYIENVNKYRKMLLNPKFNILGLFLLPTNFLWIFALFYMSYLSIDATISYVTESFRGLMAINFDIWPLIINFKPDMNILFSINPLTVFGILFTLMTVIIIYLSYKISEEKISKNYIPHLLGYFFVYFALMSLFYASAIFYKAMRGGKTRWKGAEM